MSMIILFCGIPGAGKTTIAGKLVGKLEKVGTVKLIMSDALKTPVYKKMINLLIEHQGKFDFLVFDATFFREAYRENMKSLATEKVITAFCDVSTAGAIERNRTRKAHVPIVALRTITSRMEKPTDPNIYVNTEEVSADEAARKIFLYVSRLVEAKG